MLRPDWPLHAGHRRDSSSEPSSSRQALERILVRVRQPGLDEEVIAITRLVTSESDRFPELGSAFYEGAFRRTREAIEGWLRRQCHQGLLALDDPVSRPTCCAA